MRWFAPLSLLLAASAAAGCGKLDPEDLSTEQLSMVINGRRPELQQCYQQAMADNASRESVELHAAIYIRPSGEVYKVEVDDAKLTGLSECIEKAISSWKFPTAPDETHASLPLIFRPEEAAAGTTSGSPPATAAGTAPPSTTATP